MINTQREVVTLRYPVTAFWETSNLCNLSCLHCYTNSSPQKKVFTDRDKAFALVDEMACKGIYSFGIGGGEPLVVPYLCELLTKISDHGMKVSISTNGTLINRKKAQELKGSGLGVAQVSLDGCKERHEYIRGKNTFEKTIDGIFHLVENGISVRIGYTVNKINYEDILPITRLAKEIGADSIVFFRYMPSNTRGKELELNKQSLLYAAQRILEAKKLKEQREGKSFLIYYERLSFFSFLLDERELEHVKCLAGQGMCNITASGDVTVCPHLAKAVGNIWDQELGDIWRRMNDEVSSLDAIPPECEECVYADRCRGGCKGISYCMDGGYAKKDICCFRELLNG